jgi:hypothetical protein
MGAMMSTRQKCQNFKKKLRIFQKFSNLSKNKNKIKIFQNFPKIPKSWRIQLWRSFLKLFDYFVKKLF